MSNGFNIDENNIKKFIDAMEDQVNVALSTIGIKAEKFAKARCPVGTVQSTGIKGYRGGTLRNSITHEVDTVEHTVTVGSNVEYAPYVELGTGPYFQSPPQWEQFDTPSSKGTGHGYVKPRPYLRPALEDHINLYEKILKDNLM